MLTPRRHSRQPVENPKRQRTINPADYGLGMTVCIASIAENGQAIVIATDQMASMATVTADHTMVKGEFIGLRWFAMWSGDEITSIPAIIRRAEKHLKEDRSQDWTPDQTAAALSTAYQDETRARAVAELLSPFGLDMPAFLSNGSLIFQESYQSRLRDIEQYDLGVTFLVAGHYGVTPSLFVVERRGHIKHLNKPGFWAIGAGDSLAIGALALRRHNTTRSIAETIYAVLEAKFAAELAPGVGRHTTLGVLTFDNLIDLVSAETIEAVREIWQQHSSRPAPPDAMIRIHEWWQPMREAHDRANTERMLSTLKQSGMRPDQAVPPVPQRSKRGRKGRPPSQG